MGKKHGWAYFLRSVSHSNSMREILNRDRGDRQEALEHTTDYKQLRNGKHGYVDAWEDIPVDWHKYDVKPKRNHHKGGKTIRRVGSNANE